eukprot:300358-Rhodomonas_salina.2
MKKNEDIVSKLLDLEAYADAQNKDGHTALTLAVEHELEGSVSLLLEQQADPNLTTKVPHLLRSCTHALNPKPETRNPKPETRNPKPETRPANQPTNQPTNPLVLCLPLSCRAYPDGALHHIPSLHLRLYALHFTLYTAGFRVLEYRV